MRLESMNSIIKRLAKQIESAGGNYGRPTIPGKNYNFLHPWYYQEDLLAHAALYNQYEAAEGQEKEKLLSVLQEYTKWIEENDIKGFCKKSIEDLAEARAKGLVA